MIRTCQKHRIMDGGIPTSREYDSARGQALVEFAIVAITFFLLVFALMDFSWLMFNQMNMQDAVREAARYAATGNHYVPDPTTGVQLNRSDSIKHILNQSAAGSYCTPVISSKAGGVGSAGAPGDTVTITAICAIPMLTSAISNFLGSDSKYHFTVSSTFKNEQFAAAQTY